MAVQGYMMRLLPLRGHADMPGHDCSEAARGPIMPPRPGTATITIRLDHTALAWFHSQVHAHGGGNYHTLINDMLRNDIAEGE
jgi:uncharacterized protein (DUF4415 family)